MKKIYTCFACGFPIACPGCGAPRSQFLEEPWCGSIDKRRIHVDPPEVDPNRDPFDISFHPAKDFIPQKGDGRIRRWVMGYKKGQADEMRSFYTDLFGWDIIDVEEGSLNPAPSMIIEVKNIDETVKKAKECGGKLIRDRFQMLGDNYAVIEDSEGNRYYLWELPDLVPDYCIHGVANTGAQ